MPLPSLLVVTGAGISVASGIPTFRGQDTGALWNNEDMDKVTRAFFTRHPVESWRWHLRLFGSVFAAQPNDGHRLLSDLERDWRGEFLLVTQNIDSLHERACSRRLIKVHGSMDRVRCVREGCGNGAPRGSLPLDLETVRKGLAQDIAPHCGACGSLMRPHVLWFDEMYNEHEDYGFDRICRFAAAATTMLFVGTSFSVGVTDLLIGRARESGARTIVVDPDPVNVPDFAEVRRGTADQVLAAVIAELVG
jgi:NAD-dependent deacetylase